MDMNNAWKWCVAPLFFAAGQIILRKSFDTKVHIAFPYLFAVSCLSMTIGVMGAFMLLFLSIFDPLSTKGFFQNGIQCGFPFLAGVFFFIGLCFWLYSIATKHPVGLLRILMLGLEIFLLFLLGIILFHDKITFLQLFGSLVIFIGVCFIVYELN
jgi:drug/metabolite transporter (DMT)-like permease